MKVTPIDAEIVAGTVEDVLVARTDRENIEPRSLIAEGHHLLAAIIDRDYRIDVEQKRNPV